MTVKVLLYAHCIRIPSSRRIEKRLEEDIGFRVLAANNTSDFRTISDFRKEHLKALAGLFLQALRLCRKAGLVKLGHVTIDGTKIRANASKHKAMSYKRMKDEEACLEAEIAELLKKHRLLMKKKTIAMAGTSVVMSYQRSWLSGKAAEEDTQEARKALEAEAKAVAKAAASINKKHSGVPEDKSQRNLTDPESHIMPTPRGKHFVQAYNAQAAVDSTHQVIVAAEVTNKLSDRGQAEPMMEIVKENTGPVAKPDVS